jgi:hypothetical protein
MRQIRKALQEVFDDPTRRGIDKSFLYSYKNQVMTNVVYSTAAATNFTTVGQFTLMVDGVLVQPLASNANVTLPAGFVVPNTAGSQWGVCGLAFDKFGNTYFFPGTQTFGSLGAIIFPTPPDTKDGVVVTTYFILNNGSAGTFTGGATNTNTAGLVWTFTNQFAGNYGMNNYGQA